MLRLAAKIVYRLPAAALVLYATTGVGILGPKALEANHALTARALNGFTNMGERYFEAHPIIPTVPLPAQSAPRP